MQKRPPWRRLLVEEQGTVLITTMFFLICLFGLVSLLLLHEQATVLNMRTQQTADLITKGARTAGKWTYIDPETGKKHTILFRTTSEARARQAKIIRGAREEAAILYKLNQSALYQEADRIEVEHQKGEKRWLYNAGIYHLAIDAEREALHVWDSVKLVLRRVSQSGLYRNSSDWNR